MYSDFESINDKNNIEEDKSNNIKKNTKKPKSTEKLTNHQVCSYGYKLVCTIDDIFSKPVKLYRGENAVYKFIEDIF